ncbi:MAG: hypothetical protein ACI9XP_001889 [Lentimonas sp.]|jgi:hypothetical protein
MDGEFLISKPMIMNKYILTKNALPFKWIFIDCGN